jgi:hypothetical protein
VAELASVGDATLAVTKASVRPAHFKDDFVRREENLGIE